VSVTDDQAVEQFWVNLCLRCELQDYRISSSVSGTEFVVGSDGQRSSIGPVLVQDAPSRGVAKEKKDTREPPFNI
jgi:hypothetical protein